MCVFFITVPQWFEAVSAFASSKNRHELRRIILFRPFLLVKSPAFIAGFYHYWFAFTPAYFGRILTRCFLQDVWTSHKKRSAPPSHLLNLLGEHRSALRQSAQALYTWPMEPASMIDFAPGQCGKSGSLRNIEGNDGTWSTMINKGSCFACFACFAIVSSLVSGSTGESPPKSGWEKGLRTQVVTNGMELHHSAFRICLLWPGKAWERKTWPQHGGVLFRDKAPKNKSCFDCSQMIFLHPGEWPWAEWKFALLQKSCRWIGSRICIIWCDMMQYCRMLNTYYTP